MTPIAFKPTVDGVTFDVAYQIDDDGIPYAQAVHIGGVDLIGHLSEATLIEIEKQADADYAAYLDAERQSAIDSKAEDRLWECAA